jgi:hypothetical protein
MFFVQTDALSIEQIDPPAEFIDEFLSCSTSKKT